MERNHGDLPIRLQRGEWKMKKQEFLDLLKNRLWALPERDIQQSLDYYKEMIDDRMEDGLSEEDAVRISQRFGIA